MNKVVYLTGAGFSAPLGVPTMSNFMDKARDFNGGGNTEFAEVLNRVHNLSNVKNYLKVDLFHIEDIASLLEMDAQLLGEDPQKVVDSYKRFISQTIAHYTPTFSASRGSMGLPDPFVASMPSIPSVRHYGEFLLRLIGVTGRLHRDGPSLARRLSLAPEDNHSYSLLTMNYDLVVERCLDALDHFFLQGDRASVNERLNYVKLHGTVQNDQIVLPSWNKSVSLDLSPWRLAYKALSECNHLRILGYSLPESDSYFRFLIGAAWTRRVHVKKIDVITRDTDGETRARYEKLFAPATNRLRFQDAKIEDYLRIVGANLVEGPVQNLSADHAGLEQAHDYFMGYGA